MDDAVLLAAARDALDAAYAPYSEYRVGAALETADGTVFTGCNVENANYSNSLHAEEVALSAAVERGHRTFSRIAVTSSERDGVLPCGTCRQTLAEFCGEEFRVLCEADEGREPTEYRLGELLPNAISQETLGN
jgi:cytidine deaminase